MIHAYLFELKLNAMLTFILKLKLKSLSHVRLFAIK